MLNQGISSNADRRGRPRVLLVDDDPEWSELVCHKLRRGYACECAPTLEHAERILRERNFDLLLLDLKFEDRPEEEAFEFLRSARRSDSALPVIVVSGSRRPQFAFAAARIGATSYLTKSPEDQDALPAEVERAVQCRRDHLRRSAEALGLAEECGFLCVNRSSQRLWQQICQAAPSPLPVLLWGETGTGKSLVAEILHGLSGRPGPLVRVHCASLNNGDPAIAAGELFGTYRGAYTGAVDRAGILESVGQGTLFLDDVDDLSPDIQQRMLDVLDGKPFRRLGGQIGRSKDAVFEGRLICACKPSFQRALDEGRFRLDLFHRIFGLELLLLPLRHRREDIVPIARRELRRIRDARSALGPCQVALSREAERWIEAQEWPGNIRELLQATGRAAHAADFGLLEPHHFKRGGFISDRASAPTRETGDGQAEAFPLSGKMARDLEQLRRMEHAVAEAKGNLSAAARKLNMARAAFSRRLKTLRERFRDEQSL